MQAELSRQLQESGECDTVALAQTAGLFRIRSFGDGKRLRRGESRDRARSKGTTAAPSAAEVRLLL